MFSKFPSFPFSITKCDIGGGGAWKRIRQKAALKGGGEHRGEGGRWGVRGDGP